MKSFNALTTLRIHCSLLWNLCRNECFFFNIAQEFCQEYVPANFIIRSCFLKMVFIFIFSAGSSFETSNQRPHYFNNSGQSVESINDGSYLVKHSFIPTSSLFYIALKLRDVDVMQWKLSFRFILISFCREKNLHLPAQTVEILKTTTYLWILAPPPPLSTLPWLTALRTTTFPWALVHTTLTSQGSLPLCQPGKAVQLQCATDRAVWVMSRLHQSTATLSPTEKVRDVFWSFQITVDQEFTVMGYQHQRVVG